VHKLSKKALRITAVICAGAILVSILVSAIAGLYGII